MPTGQGLNSLADLSLQPVTGGQTEMHLLSVLPILAPISTGGLRTYSPWPVWAGSTTEVVKPVPMTKKAALKLWNCAKGFDRQTNKPGHHGGAVGPTALAVLQSLIFTFQNWRSGRLDPSYAAIAKASNLCRRTVATALKRLRDLGIVDWTRRCTETRTDTGQYVLEQKSNAYALMPSSGWQGYHEPPEPPGPAPGTWGDHPPLPDVVALADEERRHGGGKGSVLSILASDPTDGLAAVLAKIGAAILRRKTQ